MIKSLLLAGLILFSHQGVLAETEQQSRQGEKRKQMIQTIRLQGVQDEKVLGIIKSTPRQDFVPEQLREFAYANRPLPIGEGQTISQPYIVAYMTEALELKSTDKVLEIGTGSGYQAAILAQLAKHVYSIEIVESLGKSAIATLKQLGYQNVSVRIGDGYIGWPEQAPFDAIILTAAPPHDIPPPLIEQLAEGGRLIAPVGKHSQKLVLLRKKNGEILRKKLLPVRFVPMTGKAQTK